MNNGLISVIVPAYNAEKTIGKLIEAVLSQTYSLFEMVIVNDGSNDATSKIVRNFDDKRIKLLEKKKGGVSSARNYGLSHSNGEFITFVDADDLVSNDFLQILYDGIVANDNDISVCGVVKVRDSNAEAFNVAEACYQIELQEIGTKMALLNRSFVYAKMYKKSIIDQSKLQFDETMSLGEDTLFVMQYLTNIKNGAYISNKRLYHYICGDISSLSNKYHDDIDKVYEKIYDATYELTKVYKGFNISYSKERLVATMTIQNLYSAGCNLNTRERRRVIQDLMKNEIYRNSILNEMNFRINPDGLRKIAFFFKCPMMIDLPFSIIAGLKKKGKIG